MICKILELFVNNLTADDKYCLLNSEKLLEHIQMQLCQKEKTFSQLFFASLNFRLNFDHFEKKDDPHSRCGFELSDSEKRG